MDLPFSPVGHQILHVFSDRAAHLREIPRDSGRIPDWLPFLADDARNPNGFEVWFWGRNKLELFGLCSSEAYTPSGQSRLLPGLEVRLLQRSVALRSWQQARRAFRAGLAKSR